jgi:hypothetical protein
MRPVKKWVIEALMFGCKEELPGIPGQPSGKNHYGFWQALPNGSGVLARS